MSEGKRIEELKMNDSRIYSILQFFNPSTLLKKFA